MNTEQQHSRINDALHEIHRNIDGDLNAAGLARVAAYSEQHFHRLFQQITGESVNHYIRRTRLEQAANQLMFDDRSSVLEVAQKCGFHSLSSFSRVFKETFGCSPGRWRSSDAQGKLSLGDPDIAAGYRRVAERALPSVTLQTLAPQPVAYVRHRGYDRSITLAWQTLLAWAEQEGRSSARQLGLHHSNPAWVELSQCRYVACLAIDKALLRRGVVSSMTIPGGLHAVFALDGCYGELLPWLSKILEQWLPQSGLKMRTTPAFVDYEKNHFLALDEQFLLRFYLPVSML